MKTQQKRSEVLLEYPPFTFTSRSIASDSHAERNEDSLIADQRRGLVAVFDGVGGSIAGEIASQIARRVLHRGWERTLRQLQPEHPSTLFEDGEKSDLHATLLHLVQEAHKHIRMASIPPAVEGAQRTGTGAFCSRSCFSLR